MSRTRIKNGKPTLLIPVELQVRELDSRLLLACVAARRGFSSIIGPRREMHWHIPYFPRSIYLSKSTTSGSKSVFRMLRRLGHEIVAWDEEALVHQAPEAYYKRRLSPEALKHVTCMLAWGEENAELWRQYPQLPPNLPIHTTGHPRGDLMRAELRRLYENEVQRIRRTYRDFVLVNTNFNQINAYFPDMNLLKPPANLIEKPELSRRAIGIGMSREYAEGFTGHKKAIFEDFQQLIPALDQAFPDYNIVVRPHPVENQEVYHIIAEKCKRVHVINEGNVVPWLIAARALVHNGCTTGAEAYMLDVPAVSYRKTIDEVYDNDYHRLPNLVSHQCFDIEQLQRTLAKILTGKFAAKNGDRRKSVMDYHLASQIGPLACDRVVDVLEKILKNQHQKKNISLWDQTISRGWAFRRRLKKRYKGFKTEMSHNKAGFLAHRYPDISREDLQTRIAQFQQALDDRTVLKVEQIFNQFYRISVG